LLFIDVLAPYNGSKRSNKYKYKNKTKKRQRNKAMTEWCDAIPELVHYDTNAGYRAVLRSLMGMAPFDHTKHDPDLDMESADEFHFDHGLADAFLQQIEDRTLHHPLFCRVYGFAAARMISESPSVGVVVLMSYDYLPFFLPCLRQFVQTGSLDETDDVFVRLEKKLL